MAAVTRRLSEGMARDIAAVIDIYEDLPKTGDAPSSSSWRATGFSLSMAVLPAGDLPTPQPKPFFDLLDRALSDEICAST